jgi:NTP pyrophosphatase (non-canonical NTP hydrolase)
MRRMNILERVAPEAIKEYGLPAQLDMLIEETCELNHEICKAKRGIENKLQIAEEIADVYIMLYQIEQALGIEAAVNEIELHKLERLEVRISLHK